MSGLCSCLYSLDTEQQQCFTSIAKFTTKWGDASTLDPGWVPTFKFPVILNIFSAISMLTPENLSSRTWEPIFLGLAPYPSTFPLCSLQLTKVKRNPEEKGILQPPVASSALEGWFWAPLSLPMCRGCSPWRGAEGQGLPWLEFSIAQQVLLAMETLSQSPVPSPRWPLAGALLSPTGVILGVHRDHSWRGDGEKEGCFNSNLL